jgi:hypothetical protein
MGNAMHLTFMRPDLLLNHLVGIQDSVTGSLTRPMPVNSFPILMISIAVLLLVMIAVEK